MQLVQAVELEQVAQPSSRVLHNVQDELNVVYPDIHYMHVVGVHLRHPIFLFWQS